MVYDFNDPAFRTLLILTILTLPLKVMALWRSARNGQKVWFGSFLVLNTIGIMELVYLFYFSEKKKAIKG